MGDTAAFVSEMRELFEYGASDSDLVQYLENWQAARAKQGVPELAYADAAIVINEIHSASQHCDCGSFELAQHWRNETHGGDVWLTHSAEVTTARKLSETGQSDAKQ